MPCSIGDGFKQSCSAEPYRNTFAERELMLLKLRSELNCIETICTKHESAFLTWYSNKQGYCCNPMQLHKQSRKGQCVISAELHDQLHTVLPAIIEGKKLCTTCKIAIYEKKKAPPNVSTRSSNPASNHTSKRAVTGELKHLETDPKFFANFNPGTSRREKLKQTMKSKLSETKGMYDNRGIHCESGRDMCDCLDLSCPGCHFPCPSCRSPKCGPHCRVSRKWMYETIEHDAKSNVITNKLLSMK